MWHVLSTDEFNNWFNEVDTAAQEDIYSSVSILREFGPRLGRPHVDSLKGSKHSNMKELRVQSKGRPFRILFAFNKARNAILLVGGNKQGDKNFYKKILPVADQLLDKYSAFKE